MPGGLVSVHFGHLAVHEDEIVGNTLQRLHCLPAIGDALGDVSQTCELAGGYLLIDDIVFGEENLRVVWFKRDGEWSFVRRFLLFLEFSGMSNQREAVEKIGRSDRLHEEPWKRAVYPGTTGGSGEGSVSMAPP